MSTKKDRIILIFVTITLAITLAFAIYLINDLIPIFRDILSGTENDAKTASYINSYGRSGIVLLIIIQIFQVFSIFIPGPAVNVLAGLVFNVWIASLIGIIGSVIGNFIVFYLVRTLRRGKPSFIKKYTTNNKLLTKITDYKDQHPRLVIFLLYLIPVLPNGILPYFFANSPVRNRDYLVAMTLGLTPVVILFTYLGKTIADGNYWITILMICLILIILGLVQIYIHKDKILKRK